MALNSQYPQQRKRELQNFAAKVNDLHQLASRQENKVQQGCCGWQDHCKTDRRDVCGSRRFKRSCLLFARLVVMLAQVDVSVCFIHDMLVSWQVTERLGLEKSECVAADQSLLKWHGHAVHSLFVRLSARYA